MQSRICLIRHGITEGNQRRLYYGSADIPLLQEGKDALKELVSEGIYPDGSNADFYITDLKRTEETLLCIYGEKPFVRIPLLREINFGDFEMKSYDELKDLSEYAAMIEDTEGNTAPPNGESLSQFRKRIMQGYDILRNMHEKKLSPEKAEGVSSIVICHGGTIAAILNQLFPEEGKNFYERVPLPGRGCMMDLQNGEAVAYSML